MDEQTLALMVQKQIELEKLYDKHELIPTLRSELEDSGFDFKDFFETANVPYEFGISLLVQLMIHKRCNPETMIGIMRAKAKTTQEAADLIMVCVRIGCVHYEESVNMLMSKFTVSSDLQYRLDQFQYPLPMVIPPEPVKKNSDIGYLTRKGSIILKDNFHTDDVCLEIINKMNSVPLTINKHTAVMVKNKWRNLDKRKPSESNEDFQKRRKAFEKYDSVSRETINKIFGESSIFYLTHAYDKRGRMYCQGHHINYQGTDWNKAIVEFAEEEIIYE